MNSTNEGAAASALDWEVLRGLMWIDWRRHRLGAVTGVIAVGICMLVIGVDTASGAARFFWLSIFMGLGLGVGLGRADWFEGEEEYALSLPPMRRERYLARFLFGLAVMAALYAIGVLTCFTDLPRSLGALLDMPMPALDEPPPYFARMSGPTFTALALTSPLALYVESFALSTGVHGRDDLSWLWELPAVILGGIGLYLLDEAWMGRFSGWLVGPALLLFSVLRWRMGARTYHQREAVVQVQASGLQSAKPVVALVLITVLAVLFTLGLWAYYAAAKN